MGAVEEIHNRERELALRLARHIVERLRTDEGAMETDPPHEIEWGLVRFQLKVQRAPIEVTLKISP